MKIAYTVSPVPYRITSHSEVSNHTHIRCRSCVGKGERDLSDLTLTKWNRCLPLVYDFIRIGRALSIISLLSIHPPTHPLAHII